MSPPEIDLAPELIGQVLDAVDKGFERQLAFTQQMMSLDSGAALTFTMCLPRSLSSSLGQHDQPGLA